MFCGRSNWISRKTTVYAAHYAGGANCLRALLEGNSSAVARRTNRILTITESAAVSYFEQKFGAYSREELGELVAKRRELSDEAIEALDRVLAKKGMKDVDVIAASNLVDSPTEKDENESVAVQTKRSRALWRGGLATTCKILVGLTFIAPVQNLLQSIPLGALWAGLLILIAGYAGYRVGHVVTRHICADAEVTVEAKKKRLWLMFFLLWPLYFFVYAISYVVFFVADRYGL